ncbi:uncharacterized protein LOC134044144 [Cinclus cinclus]|uniref:uncharacterized protein LOC134044144 n=1 Tax=Cinclus cinclus TaxID=127875 RepID=UPI002E1324EF
MSAGEISTPGTSNPRTHHPNCTSSNPRTHHPNWRTSNPRTHHPNCTSSNPRTHHPNCTNSKPCTRHPNRGTGDPRTAPHAITPLRRRSPSPSFPLRAPPLRPAPCSCRLVSAGSPRAWGWLGHTAWEVGRGRHPRSWAAAGCCPAVPCPALPRREAPAPAPLPIPIPIPLPLPLPSPQRPPPAPQPPRAARAAPLGSTRAGLRGTAPSIVAVPERVSLLGSAPRARPPRADARTWWMRGGSLSK